MASAVQETDPITLDGRTLEGGGQLLRLALGLASLTSTPLRVHSIRGNRSGGGGLKAQHLACVNWLAYACRASVEGAEKGSKELLFVPGAGSDGYEPGLSPAFKKVRIRSEDGNGTREIYEARLDIKTAGSTGLVLQAILPFVLFTAFPSPLPVRLTLTGGTNVSQSPSYEYITCVLLPTLEAIGFPRIDTKLGKRGWSQGGSSIGNFALEIPPRSSTVLPAFSLMPPTMEAAGGDGVTTCAKPQIRHLHATFIAPSSCHEHFRTSLRQSLKSHFPSRVRQDGLSFTESHGNLTLELEDSRHPKRMYLILVATVAISPLSSSSSSSDASNPAPPSKPFKLARDWLYDRKLPNNPTVASHDGPAESMAEKVSEDLAAEIESGACVDEFMRDQLVVFQALAHGRSRVYGGRDDGGLREPSLHAKTAEWVAETLLGERGVAFDGEGGARGCGFGGDDGDGAVERDVAGKMVSLEVG